MNKELVKLIFVVLISVANLSAVYILLNEDGMLKQKRSMDSVITDSKHTIQNAGTTAKNMVVNGSKRLKEIVVPEKKEVVKVTEIVAKKTNIIEKVK